MGPMLLCAQLSGISLTVVAVAMLSRPRNMIIMVERMLENPPLIFVLGTAQFVAGLGLVLTLDVSTGATLPLVLTLLGWWLIARGVMLMFLTQDALWSLVDSIELPKYHFASNVIGLILGGYLTYVGFAEILGLSPILTFAAKTAG